MRFFQPTLFNRSVRTKVTSVFSVGGKKVRQTKRHSTGLQKTSAKYTLGGSLFSRKRR